jgi:prefoldin subunit 5
MREMMKRALVLISMAGLGFLFAFAVSEDTSQQKAELESVKTELQQLKPDIEKTESEKNALEVKIALAEHDCKKLQEQVNELTDSRDKLQKQVEEFTFSREQSRQQLAEIIGTRDNLKKQVIELSGSRDKLQQQLTELNTSHNQLGKQVEKLIESRDEAVAKAQKAQERIEILVAMQDSETQEFGEGQDELTVTNQVQEDEQPPMVEIIEYPAASTEVSRPAVIPSHLGERPTCQSFNTTRPRIMPGQTSTLSWQVSNAQRIRIEPGIGAVSALGSRTVKPSVTTTYTLIAENKAGQSRLSCRIEINERITIFSTDSIRPQILLEEDSASSDRKVLPGQKLPVSDPNATLGKFIGYRARKDESGKFIFIPVYETKQKE